MALKYFLESRGLAVESKLSKGYSAEVFLVQNRNGEIFALKLEKAKSRRIEMVEKEAGFLGLANSVGVGPRLVGFDLRARCILMEFVVGARFCDWLFDCNPSKAQLMLFLRDLFAQAQRLDAIGLSHGQLGGRGTNILVRNGLPVIIDFEKASNKRAARNALQLCGNFFLSPHSKIAERIKAILQG